MRKSTGVVTGAMKFDGETINGKMFRNVSSYAPQVQ